jgi:hypothetical protein
VLAIYATLGLARTLAGALGDSGLDVVLFVLGVVLVGAAIVTRGLNARPGGIEIAVALGVAAAYLMVFVRMAIPTVRTHLIEYGVVGALIHEALTERASNGRTVPVAPLLAVLATSLIGMIDEFIQAFLPSRVFDPRDILFNALAGAMAVGASIALSWARQWRSQA